MSRFMSEEFSLSYYPDQDIKQFCNHDGSHRFSLIHDYLTRNGIDKYLEFNVWEESINKDFLFKIQSKYQSFILPRILSKNNSVTDFFRYLGSSEYKRQSKTYQDILTFTIQNPINIEVRVGNDIPIYNRKKENLRYITTPTMLNMYTVVFIPRKHDMLIETLKSLGYSNFLEQLFKDI